RCTSHSSESKERQKGFSSHSGESKERQKGFSSHSGESKERQKGFSSHSGESKERQKGFSSHSSESKERQKGFSSHSGESKERQKGFSSHSGESKERQKGFSSHSGESKERQKGFSSHSGESKERQKGFSSHSGESKERQKGFSSHSGESKERQKGFSSHSGESKERQKGFSSHSGESKERQKGFSSHSGESKERQKGFSSHSGESKERQKGFSSHSGESKERQKGFSSHSGESKERQKGFSSHSGESKERQKGFSSHSGESKERQKGFSSHSGESKERQKGFSSHSGESKERQKGFSSHSARRKKESLRKNCKFTQRPPRGNLTEIPVVKTTHVESGQFLFLSVLCMIFILVALLVSTTFFCLRQRSHLRLKEKLSSLGTDTSTDATATYQELCRQRMAIRTSERVERPETLRNSRLNSVSSQFSDGPAASPSTRSSTSSWCEEPSYMEDHLKNKNRLEREWEALCSYQAEPGAWSVGHGEQNSRKNRSDAVVVYDHSRITLKAENNLGNSDYINASPIMDHDPRNPTYISSQGPLLSTVADFWQMVWESGCVVVVMLTPLSENGVKQCHPYWPDEGSDVYHVYEVNLVSEHIWCEDFLVRSFYLKNLQTNETRTVTQFHFLSWMDRGIPNSARTLLDFRRKVNKCYRGAKEIDIAATLEHLRDQRAGMVQTKEQFEFGLTAVAEEVNAILKALP
ncbi:hypothetical protein JOQ06_014196, partial [Pogonophryne albipinna]